MDIAIYDLDRTITRRPTFTPFLTFMAQKRAPWRLLFAPVWVLLLLTHKLGLASRKMIKQAGLALFVGREMQALGLEPDIAEYADRVVADGILPGARNAIEADRRQGYMLVLATAAPEIYAHAIANRLCFDEVIATRHRRLPDGGYRNLFDGENCYGAEKLSRVTAWLSDKGIDRADIRVRVYSDHLSDAPLLDWADEAVLVTRNSGGANGNAAWRVQDWS